MVNAWVKTFPTTRIVNVSTNAGLAAAISTAIPGDQIRVLAGNYSGNYIATVNATAANPIVLLANGYVFLSGSFSLQGKYWVVYGWDISGRSASDAACIRLDAEGCCAINNWCWQPVGATSGQGIVAWNQGANQVVYGNVVWNCRHSFYSQNDYDLYGYKYFVHNIVLDVRDDGTGNQFHFHAYTQSQKVTGYYLHQNILRLGRSIFGIDNAAGALEHHQVLNGNVCYRATMQIGNKVSVDYDLNNNYFASCSFVCQRSRITIGAGNQFTPDVDSSNYMIVWRTGEPCTAAINASCSFDNNFYNGAFKAHYCASSNNQVNVSTIAQWRTLTASGGVQFDTNSAHSVSEPADTEKLFVNEYNDKLANLAIINWSGAASRAVVMPWTDGKIMNPQDPSGSPLQTWSGGTVVNVNTPSEFNVYQLVKTSGDQTISPSAINSAQTFGATSITNQSSEQQPPAPPDIYTDIFTQDTTSPFFFFNGAQGELNSVPITEIAAVGIPQYNGRIAAGDQVTAIYAELPLILFTGAALELGAIPVEPTQQISEQFITNIPSISSAESVSTPTVSYLREILPEGIGSLEGFGNNALFTIRALPTGIASASAFGTPALSSGAVIGPESIPSLFQTGTATIRMFITASGIATAQTFGTPTVISPQTITATGIASAESLGIPLIETGGDLSVIPVSISSGQAFGAVSVTFAAIAPAGIASAQAMGAVTVTAIKFLFPESIGSPAILGTPIIGTWLTATSITSGQAFGTPNVLRGTITLSPGAIVTLEQFGSPAFSSHKIITISSIPSQQEYGEPTINQQIRAVGIPSDAEFGIAITTRTINAIGVVSGETFGTAQINRTITAVGIPTSETVSSPRIDKILQPSGIPTGAAFGTGVLHFTTLTVSIPSAEAFGTARLNRTITATGIISSESFGSPSNTISILLVGDINSAENFGTAAMMPDLFLRPLAIPGVEEFGTAKINRQFSVSGIPTAEIFGSPRANFSITVSGIPTEYISGTAQLNQAISITGIPSEEIIGPLVLRYNQFISIPAIPPGTNFPTPVISNSYELVYTRGIKVKIRPSTRIFTDVANIEDENE